MKFLFACLIFLSIGFASAFPANGDDNIVNNELTPLFHSTSLVTNEHHHTIDPHVDIIVQSQLPEAPPPNNLRRVLWIQHSLCHSLVNKY